MLFPHPAGPVTTQMCWIWSAGGVVVVVVLLLVLPHMELATELVNGLLLTGPRVESTTAAAAFVMVGCWGRSPAESMVVMLLVEQVEKVFER